MRDYKRNINNITSTDTTDAREKELLISVEAQIHSDHKKTFWQKIAYYMKIQELFYWYFSTALLAIVLIYIIITHI